MKTPLLDISDQDSTIDSSHAMFRLSGPVSASCTFFEDKIYYLFGDRHFDMMNKCEDDCTRLDDTGLKIGSDDCIDVTAWLDSVFTSGQQIDFYLETFFIKNDFSYEYIEKRIDTYGYLALILARFWSCFTKTTCRYPLVRFHYIDVRHTFRFDRTIPSLYEWTSQMVSGIGEKVCRRDKNTLYSLRLFSRYIEVLVHPDTPLLKTIYDLMVYSDDFNTHASILFEPLLSIGSKYVRTELEAIVFQRAFVSRTDDKTQHRIRKQLYALEQQGRKDLADKIRTFIKTEWDRQYNELRLDQHWIKLINIYTENKTCDIDIYRHIRHLVAMEALLMDAYTLARMLRKFVNPSTISIVYAGEAHIQRYRSFFKTLDAKTFKFASKDDARCVHVSTSLFKFASK